VAGPSSVSELRAPRLALYWVAGTLWPAARCSRSGCVSGESPGHRLGPGHPQGGDTGSNPVGTTRGNASSEFSSPRWSRCRLGLSGHTKAQDKHVETGWVAHLSSRICPADDVTTSRRGSRIERSSSARVRQDVRRRLRGYGKAENDGSDGYADEEPNAEFRYASSPSLEPIRRMFLLLSARVGDRRTNALCDSARLAVSMKMVQRCTYRFVRGLTGSS
jgi:hypothetical protein